MLYLDGGHCGKGNLMRTMRLVKFEIDPGSSLYIVNTTKTKYNVNCAFTNLHIQPLSVTAPPLQKCQPQTLFAVRDHFNSIWGG